MNVSTSREPAKAQPPKKVSWEAFERRYLDKEDKYKYEWSDGEVIKTLRTMNQSQQIIYLNLIGFLDKLKTKNTDLGALIPECETWFGEAYRRPDIAYFSPPQIEKFGKTNQVPQFVIEVISKNDQLNKANDKLLDYRKAGVTVVWFIFPKSKEVHVYRGKQMTICSEKDTCSAEPVVPGFVVGVGEVFK